MLGASEFSSTPIGGYNLSTSFLSPLPLPHLGPSLSASLNDTHTSSSQTSPVNGLKPKKDTAFPSFGTEKKVVVVYNNDVSPLDSNEYVYEDDAQFVGEYLMEEVIDIFLSDGSVRLVDYRAYHSICSNRRTCNPSSINFGELQSPIPSNSDIQGTSSLYFPLFTIPVTCFYNFVPSYSMSIVPCTPSFEPNMQDNPDCQD